MSDRIAQILEAHIALERRKLEALKSGASLSWYSDLEGSTPITLEAVEATVQNMEAALERHRSRGDAQRP